MTDSSFVSDRWHRRLRQLELHRDRMLRQVLRLAPPGLIRIGVDAQCPAWLRVSPGSLLVELVRRGIWPILFSGDDLDQCRACPAEGPSQAAIDTAIYQLCIQEEILPDELADRIRASALMGTRYHAALHAAQRREAALEALVSRLRLSTVAYMQGYTPIAAAMRGVASRRGIGMVAFENTLFNDRVDWNAGTGVTCPSDRARQAFQQQAAEPKAEGRRAVTWPLEGGVRHLKAPEHRSGSQPVPVAGPFVLFLGQVLTDSSLVFGCRSGWGPLQVVDHVRRWLAGTGMTLVIKGHPKEAKGFDPLQNRPYNRLFARRLHARFPDLASAPDCLIDADNRLDTYAAIRAAACVVTMNSQAGIESAALGVPTIVCARASYGSCGFTLDGSTPMMLTESLRACMRTTQDDRIRSQRSAAGFLHMLRDQLFVPRTASAVAEVIAGVVRHGHTPGGMA